MVLTGASLTSSWRWIGRVRGRHLLGGVSGGSIGDGSGNASSTVAAGSAEATTVLSRAIFVTGSAAVATSALATTAALPVVAACGAFARSASAMELAAPSIGGHRRHSRCGPNRSRQARRRPNLRERPFRTIATSLAQSLRVHHPRLPSKTLTGAALTSQARDGADLSGQEESRNDAN